MTRPIGCRANLPIRVIHLAMNPVNHFVLPVNFLPRCNSKRLESSDRIAVLDYCHTAFRPNFQPHFLFGQYRHMFLIDSLAISLFIVPRV